MLSYLPGRCWWHLQRWWKLPLNEQLDYFRGRWAALRFWMKWNRPQPIPVTAPPPLDSQPPEVPGFMDYYHAVAYGYRLRPYPGSADFFVSDQGKSGWRWYWRYLVRGGISFHRVPGGHNEIMFSPKHRPALAKALASVLHSKKTPG
jgi:hypothetical protein